jgi:hypothetical protein
MHWRGAAVVALVLAAPATAQAQDEFPAGSRPGPNQKLAAQTWNAATRTVARRWPACDTLFAPPRGQVSDGPIPAGLLADYAILRRPGTPAEAALADESGPRAPLPVLNAVRSSVRVVRTLGDGTQVLVFVGSGPELPPRRPEVCRTREAREARRQARGLPAQARRAVARIQRTAARFERRRPLRPTPPPAMAFVTTAAPGGSVRGAASGMPFVTPRAGRSLVTTLVPDGVARVEVALARGRNAGTGRTYPAVERISAGVVDNVAIAHPARPPGDAYVTRQIWTAPDGTVVPHP